MNLWTKRMAAAFLAVLTMAASGCSAQTGSSVESPTESSVSSVQESSSEESSAGSSETSETESQTRIFTDSCGREVEIPSQIDRIAPSGPMAQMVLFSLTPDKMVGWSATLSESAADYIGEKYASLPVYGQFYGKNANLNIEALAAADPQVIIDIGEAKEGVEEDMDGIQEQTGIPTLFIEAELDTMGDAYRLLGDLLGAEESAEALASYCEETVETAKEKAASIPEDQLVTVYFGEGETGLETNPKGSLQADVIDLVGGVNVAEMDKVTSSGGNEINMEQLLLWDPDVILFGPNSVYASVESDPLWADVRAIQDGKFYEVPEGPYNWMNRPPSVNRIIGIRWLGNLLYPDLYQYDMVAEAQEFYKLFYHYDLTEDQAKALLANSTLKE